MKKVWVAGGLLIFAISAKAQLTQSIAYDMSQLPLKCIHNEYPNKTSHLADSDTNAILKPHELHPSFYGCLDWHSSVHGHWMLAKVAKSYPDIANYDTIMRALVSAFQTAKIATETEYFGKYTASNTYERTYGWAWLLKLDNELRTWNNPLAQQWYQSLQPLTQKIVALWKAYLPKQPYPSRMGMHPNTAFGLTFALEWAKENKDTAFENLIVAKGKAYFLHDRKIPAHLEPDGADFFSPSLEEAELMSKILSQKSFAIWLNGFFTPEGIAKLSEPPMVGDKSDYQTVHLQGLYFTRAWCMKHIAAALPVSHPLKYKFETLSKRYIHSALPELEKTGYGGEHWLATFAVYALTE